MERRERVGVYRPCILNVSPHATRPPYAPLPPLGCPASSPTRGDFQYKQVKMKAAAILNETDALFQPNEHLFIATDERNKKWFDVFKVDLLLCSPSSSASSPCLLVCLLPCLLLCLLPCLLLPMPVCSLLCLTLLFLNNPNSNTNPNPNPDSNPRSEVIFFTFWTLSCMKQTLRPWVILTIWACWTK